MIVRACVVVEMLSARVQECVHAPQNTKAVATTARDVFTASSLEVSGGRQFC